MKRKFRSVAVALFLPMLIVGCATAPGNDSKPAPVNLSEACEALAVTVPHAAFVAGKTPAALAHRREIGQLDKANDRILATRECQCRQRMQLAGYTPANANRACLSQCNARLQAAGYSARNAADVCRAGLT